MAVKYMQVLVHIGSIVLFFKKLHQVFLNVNFFRIAYSGSSPNAHFGTRKKPCQAKSHYLRTLGLHYEKMRNNRTNYSTDAIFFVPKPKPCWSEIRVRRNRVRRGPLVLTQSSTQQLQINHLLKDNDQLFDDVRLWEGNLLAHPEAARSSFFRSYICGNQILWQEEVKEPPNATSGPFRIHTGHFGP